MLDLHVHVLPGIDDGPRTLDDALALARALADDGIEHIVATPHIYLGVFDNSAARIGETFDAFQTAVSDAGIDLTMTWAAEVRICPEILEWIELRRLPMLNGSLVGPSTALIELPDGQIPVGTDKLMGLMLERGITPLMAHPERNKAVMEQPTRLEALRRMGCKFQLTAGSVLGDFGSRAQSTAQKLLEAGWIDVIATDAHNLSSRRPRLGAARDWITQHYDEALALKLTKTQPTEIAGVSSFTFQAGEQKLVFRDLPAAATPLDTAQAWSIDLTLDAVQPPGELAPPPSESAKDRWSLIDFRIDALVADLQSTSLQPDLLSDHVATPQPLAAEPVNPPEPAEDWRLPIFDAPPARPAAQAQPAPAPMPAPAPPLQPLTVLQPPAVAPASPVRTVEPVAVAVVPSMPAVPRPQPAPALQPAPLVQAAPVLETAAPAAWQAAPARPEKVAVVQAVQAMPVTRGFRLNEVEQRGSPQPLQPLQQPHQPGRPSLPAPRTGPMAQVGRQATTIPTLSIAVPQAPPVAERPLPSTPGTTPGKGSRQGFRLSDLKPLGRR